MRASGVKGELCFGRLNSLILGVVGEVGVCGLIEFACREMGDISDDEVINSVVTGVVSCLVTVVFAIGVKLMASLI